MKTLKERLKHNKIKKWDKTYGFIPLVIVDINNSRFFKYTIRKYYYNFPVFSNLWKLDTDTKPKLVTLMLEYPLKKKVWKKVVIHSVGDIIVKAAKFYADIFRKKKYLVKDGFTIEELMFIEMLYKFTKKKQIIYFIMDGEQNKSVNKEP